MYIGVFFMLLIFIFFLLSQHVNLGLLNVTFSELNPSRCVTILTLVVVDDVSAFMFSCEVGSLTKGNIADV